MSVQDQIIDAVIARALQADAIRTHPLMAWIVTWGSFAQRYVKRHGLADGFFPCDQNHLIRRARGFGVPATWEGCKGPLSAVAGSNSSYHARHQSLTDQVGRPPRRFDPQTDPSNGGLRDRSNCLITFRF
jgi:hypothetical protein